MFKRILFLICNLSFILNTIGIAQSNFPKIEKGEIEFLQNLTFDQDAITHLDSVLQRFEEYSINKYQGELPVEEIKKRFAEISVVEMITSWFSNGRIKINFNQDSILIEPIDESLGSGVPAIYNRKTNTVLKKYTFQEAKELSIVFKDSLFDIKFIKEDKKIILGFECHKVIVTSKNPEPIEYFDEERTIGLEFGNSVYELWVTSRIILPVYPIVNDLLMSTDIGFPMEVTMYGSKIPGIKYKYEVVEVKRE